MVIKDNLLSIVNTISVRFSKKRKTVREKIAFIILALIKSESCKIPEIASQMGTLNGKNFHTNEMKINRLLQTHTFQVDDQLFRSHIKVVFDLLQERELLKKGDCIPINIDYTSSTDKFLILSASIPFAGRGIPIYFSMRNYPKKKDKISLRKMETAFLKELKHLLSKKYSYIIVGDRGFGNTNIIDICKELSFDYILRVAEHITFEANGIKKKLSEAKEKYDFNEVSITHKKRATRLIINPSKQNKKDAWHIITSIKHIKLEEILNQYADRFKIEKMFQDEKSSGFNIEESKIRKYDRFKRLYYLVTLSQVLLMFIGDYINGNADNIKKRFPLHINLISAFLS